MSDAQPSTRPTRFAADSRFATISEAVGTHAPADVLAPLCAATGLTLPQMRGRLPAGKMVNRFRQTGMYLLRTHAKWSYPEIGLYFDGRDHSTVIHGCRAVAALAVEDKAFGGFLAQINEAQGSAVVPSTLRRSAVLAAPVRGIIAEMRDLRADVAGLREELALLRKAMEGRRG